MARALSRQPGEGDAYWVLGGLYEVKVRSDETNGEATIMEMTVPAGMGPPPHTHAGAEALDVLEGTLRLHVGDEATDGGPGSFFYLPAGTMETFEPTSDTVRVLIVYTPGWDRQVLRRDRRGRPDARSAASAEEAPRSRPHRRCR